MGTPYSEEIVQLLIPGVRGMRLIHGSTEAEIEERFAHANLTGVTEAEMLASTREAIKRINSDAR